MPSSEWPYLESFLAIHTATTTTCCCTFTSRWGILKDRYHPGFLPIAWELGGNYVRLGCEGAAKARLYWWWGQQSGEEDLQKSVDEIHLTEPFEPICASFQEFLGLLQIPRES